MKTELIASIIIFYGLQVLFVFAILFTEAMQKETDAYTVFKTKKQVFFWLIPYIWIFVLAKKLPLLGQRWKELK